MVLEDPGFRSPFEKPIRPALSLVPLDTTKESKQNIFKQYIKVHNLRNLVMYLACLPVSGGSPEATEKTWEMKARH